MCLELKLICFICPMARYYNHRLENGKNAVLTNLSVMLFCHGRAVYAKTFKKSLGRKFRSDTINV